MNCCKCNHDLEPIPDLTVQYCPYCGAANRVKREEDHTITSLREGVSAILRDPRLGLNVLRDANSVVNVFGDLAPTLKSEKTMILYLSKCSNYRSFVEAAHQNSLDVAKLKSLIIREMARDRLITEKLAENICDQFLAGMTGESFAVEAKTVDSQEPPRMSGTELSRILMERFKGRTPIRDLSQIKEKGGFEYLSQHDGSNGFYVWAENCYLKKDYDNARSWARSAANYPPACVLLGLMEETGKGGKPNPDAAFTWYKKAAEAKDGVGQFHLGRCCLYGIGTPRDSGEAWKWLNCSAMQHFSPARMLLLAMKKRG